MDAFSLLKYWRGGGGGRGGVAVDGGAANVRSAGTGTTTIVTAVSHHVAETDDDDHDDDDDGPFFDLEFALPDDDDDEGDEQPKHEESDCAEEEGDDDGEEEEEEEIESNGTGGENEEREFKFTLSSGSSGDRTDPNVSLSPSDDLFFKGRLVPIEPSSMDFNGPESNAKSQFSLLKSATKFRVMMLKFKKSKANGIEKTEPNGSASATPKQQQQKVEEPKEKQNQTQSKFLTVKFKVEEVPIMSLFSRDSSSRASNNKSQKQHSSDESASDEKRFSKDVMQRYLKKVKPLYVRVSKRYGEKLRFSGQLSFGPSGGTKAEPSPPASKSTAAKSESEISELTESPPPPPPLSAGNAKSQKPGNLPAGLRVVCKHLGKSRSASSAVTAASPSGSIQSKRRDDSLLQQQDGIQSAILHCKRSFNASRDSDSSLLSRSVSDSLHEKSSHLSKKC